METKDFIAIEEEYGAHNYHPLDVVIERAEGVWVYDVDGKRYLDCLSAYSAVNQGHVHPQILNALLDQAKKVTLTSRAFRNDQLPLLYKELSEMTGYEMSLPMNSGAEAVETAVKLARKWAYEVKGCAAPPGRDHHRHRKLPRADRYHCQLLYRAVLPRRFWSFHARIRHRPVWGCGGDRKGDHAQYGSRNAGADPGRRRSDHTASRVSETGCGNLPEEQCAVHGR